MVERMARKCDDHVLAELGLTAAGGTGGKFWLFLESLAFLLHTNGTRDFEQKDVRELGAAEYQLWRTVVPVLGKCSAPILCQLPSTEVTDREEVQVKNGSMRGTWRFTRRDDRSCAEDKTRPIILRKSKPHGPPSRTARRD